MNANLYGRKEANEMPETDISGQTMPPTHLSIDKISRGVVIDHIAAGRSMSIYQYLRLDRLDCSVAVIKNVKSKRLGKKDIIKIEDRIDIDMDSLGYIDPNITVNIVEGGVITRKVNLTLPHSLTDVIVCKNPRCITSIEQGITHIFDLADAENRVYRCRYCEQEGK
jgi:aspartate carbamoyltransferase regulatory subunit